MDIQQLKLLAGRVRDLLQQSNHPIGHNQSLDLIAALPGLRNWPEVQAFPDRVIACDLDLASAGRLAFRLTKKFGLGLSSKAILAALNSSHVRQRTLAPQIWPTGPQPGVYVTTSQEAINALLGCYEEATDGGLIYAERAGSHWAGSIDLGDDGLWSHGLSRLPSGTLLVIGPVELDQQSWENSAKRLEMACLKAQGAELRVAVLIDTPTPEVVCEDAIRMVQWIQSEGDDCDAALLGIVTEEGELQEREPFAHPWPRLPATCRTTGAVDALPPEVLPILKKVLAERPAGLLLFGSENFEDHPAIDLVVASLVLTDHLGPAARVMPRHRSTPAKDWQVPEAIKQLPFLPSIESAYDQGYRRIVYSPYYTDADTLLAYSEDVLLISGAYGSDVEDVFMNTLRGSRSRQETELLARVIAILGVKPVSTKRGEILVNDLFVMREESPLQSVKLGDLLAFLAEERVMKWQDAMTELLDSGAVSVAGLKKALPRNRNLAEFLSQRAAIKKIALAGG
jgi:hypothetical protein